MGMEKQMLGHERQVEKLPSSLSSDPSPPLTLPAVLLSDRRT